MDQPSRYILSADCTVTTANAAASTAAEAGKLDSPEDTLMQAIHRLEAKLDKSTHEIHILDERTSAIQQQSQA